MLILESTISRSEWPRGVLFLGWNTRFCGNEPFSLLEHALIDIGAEVDWLKREASADVVALLGNSGGGSLTAAYRSQVISVTFRPTPTLTIPRAVQEVRSPQNSSIMPLGSKEYKDCSQGLFCASADSLALDPVTTSLWSTSAVQLRREPPGRTACYG